MTSKSMVEAAFDQLQKSKEPIAYKDLYAGVANALKFDEAQTRANISKLYTFLSLDGRFVTLTDNYWDLRVRHTFDKVHIDMNDVYSDVEAEDSVDEDEEDIEYNKVLEDKKNVEEDLPVDEESADGETSTEETEF